MQYEELDPKEMVYMDDDTRVWVKYPNFQVADFLEELLGALRSNEMKRSFSSGNTAYQRKDALATLWTKTGADCQVLRFGSQGWQSGKMRLLLEFCPDRDGEEGTRREGEVKTNQQLKSKEVIYVSNSARILLASPTFRLAELTNALLDFLCHQMKELEVSEERAKRLLGTGLDCEVFRFGAEEWQPGKMRIVVGFFPDREPEPEPRDRAGAAKVEVDETPGEASDRVLDGVLNKVDEE